MKSELQELAETWENLGQEDPLWAVVTHPDKRGGRWNLAEFMATGERDVMYYRRLIANHLAIPDKFQHVLDFGCGVGRLTRVWSRHAEQVTGVDISAAMLQLAERNLSGLNHVQFVLNQHNDLRFLGDDSVDLVFSLICLQHMPWALAANYVCEFARVSRPGGIVAFQLPQRNLRFSRLSQFRKALVQHLPFGLGPHFRRWRHGSATVFEMHFTPREVVESLAAQAGLILIHVEPDASAGETTEGFFYIFKKP